MKLTEILEHEIVSQDRLKSKVLWHIPKMDRTDPPFSKGAFSKLLDVTGGKQVEDPPGGKVVRKSNTMKKGELNKPQKSKKTKRKS